MYSSGLWYSDSSMYMIGKSERELHEGSNREIVSEIVRTFRAFRYVVLFACNWIEIQSSGWCPPAASVLILEDELAILGKFGVSFPEAKWPALFT